MKASWSWFKQFVNGLGLFALIAFFALPMHADLFVSNQTEANAGNILRYDQVTGAFLGIFASGHGLAEPLGITFGADRNLYVVSGNSDQVLRFDGSTGAFLGVFAAGGGLQAPENLTFGPDGNLYVSSFPRRVFRYNGLTGAFIDVFIADDRLGFPRGLKFGPDGNLYVASNNNSTVLRYNGSTGAFIDTFVSTRSGGLFTPIDLVFGPDGNLYVTGGALPSTGVFRYNGSTGAFIDQFALTGNSFPLGLAFGPDGNLYVVTQGIVDGVFRFNGLTGAFIDHFVAHGSGGFRNLFGLAFNPVDCTADIEPPVVDYIAVKPFRTYQNPLRRVGWFRLLVSDNCDPDALIYIKGAASGFVAGPFHHGDQVEIAKGPSLTPGQSVPPSGSNVAAIRLRGDASMFGVDRSGNTSPLKKIL